VQISAAPTACRRRCSATTTFLDRKELLDFEEITPRRPAAVSLGVTEVATDRRRALIRRDVERLIAMLSELDAGVTLTTNASLLPRKPRR